MGILYGFFCRILSPSDSVSERQHLHDPASGLIGRQFTPETRQIQHIQWMSTRLQVKGYRENIYKIL